MKTSLTYLAAATSAVMVAFGAPGCSGNQDPSTEKGTAGRRIVTTSPPAKAIDPDSILLELPLSLSRYRMRPESAAKAATGTAKVVIQDIKGYGAHEPIAREAGRVLEQVVNTEAFRQLVLRGSYLNARGLSNQQIYDLIQKAHELDGPGGADGTLDLRLRVITLAADGQRWLNACNRQVGSRTVGKDGGGTGVSATCLYYIERQDNNNTPHNLAGHYMHEYLHMLGFSHAGLGNKKEQSVPYQIGQMVRAVGYQLAKPVTGTVLPDQRFKTVLAGRNRILTLYTTGMQVPSSERLDLSTYIGKRIKVRFQEHTDTEAYLAEIVR